MRAQLVVTGSLVAPLLVQTSPLGPHRQTGSSSIVMVATEDALVCVCARAAGAAGEMVAAAALSVTTESGAASLPLRKLPVPAAAAAAAEVADAVAEVEAALAEMVTTEAPSGVRATHASHAWARPCKAASPAAAASPCEAPSLSRLRASRPCLHYRG